VARTVGPLAATFRRLAAADPWFSAEVGPPAGEGWLRFDVATLDNRLSDWVDELATRHEGRRDVAGSYLGGWLAGAAIIVPTAALVLERRLPDPSGPLWVRRHPDGWFDRVAYERPHLLVTHTDAAASHRDATSVDERDLFGTHAQSLAEQLLSATLDEDEGRPRRHRV
jgi:hypothetical protein